MSYILEIEILSKSSYDKWQEWKKQINLYTVIYNNKTENNIQNINKEDNVNENIANE